MITRLDLRGMDLLGGSVDLRALVPRAELGVEAAVEAVRPICEDVRVRGEAALIDYSERFDGVRLEAVRVSREAIAHALAVLDPQVRSALEESVRRVRKVHTDQKRRDVRTQVVPGGAVTERWIPVDRVGLYVPGGLAVYPSSVVMNVVPAQVAGVGAIAVASPPQKEFGGLPHPTILAACALLGVDEVYSVGGAQAVAMFAYGAGQGVTRCAPVDMVTGPGNVYVAAAKRLLKGRVGIDAEAGPTEIAILADLGASPQHVAADLISQAEHDPLAAAVLVTDAAALAEAVEVELERQVPLTKHAQRVAAALDGRQSAIILVDDIEAGLAVVNAYGAEHLEIQTSNPRVVAGRVRNAGAVFVGPYSPVSLGDYVAGSNHVLPTSRAARFSSGLSIYDFLKRTSIIGCDAAAFQVLAGHTEALAEAEGLPAHARSISI
ncbi:MAG: histidinol dehydrogenase, partial [Actinocrinis sp.]